MDRLILRNKLLYGMGVNDSDYNTEKTINGKRTRCPYYETWSSMLQRCYSKKCQARHPTYKGCTVVKDWHSFMSFRSWMIKKNWYGKQLDKDILVIGNKIYSPETCLFVTSEINNLLNKYRRGRGNLPQGVCLEKRNGRFRARLHRYGKRISLGYYSTPEEASLVYRKAKALYIYETALQQEDVALGRALLKHGDMYASKLIPTTHKSGEKVC